MEEQDCQAIPSIHSSSEILHLKPKPVRECRWMTRSLDVLKYYYESTEGRYFIDHMVTTGPCVTAAPGSADSRRPAAQSGIESEGTA